MKLNLILALLMGILSYGSLANECNLSYLGEAHKYPAITKDELTVEGKYLSKGYIFKNADEIKRFFIELEPNETYPYIITKSGKLVISPRNITPAESKFVAHLSLLGRAQEFNSSDEVVAAGEIVTRNKMISRLSNKSGTFKSGEDSLQYSHALFKSIDDRFSNSKLEIRDYSKNSYAGDHATDLVFAKNYQEIKKDEELTKLNEKLIDLYYEIYRLLPSENIAGFVNVDRIAEITMEVMDTDDQIAMSNLVLALGHLSNLNAEGPYFYHSKDRMIEAINSIDYLAKYLNK